MKNEPEANSKTVHQWLQDARALAGVVIKRASASDSTQDNGFRQEMRQQYLKERIYVEEINNSMDTKFPALSQVDIMQTQKTLLEIIVKFALCDPPIIFNSNLNHNPVPYNENLGEFINKPPHIQAGNTVIFFKKK